MKNFSKILRMLNVGIGMTLLLSGCLKEEKKETLPTSGWVELLGSKTLYADCIAKSEEHANSYRLGVTFSEDFKMMSQSMVFYQTKDCQKPAFEMVIAAKIMMGKETSSSFDHTRELDIEWGEAYIQVTKDEHPKLYEELLLGQSKVCYGQGLNQRISETVLRSEINGLECVGIGIPKRSSRAFDIIGIGVGERKDKLKVLALLFGKKTQDNDASDPKMRPTQLDTEIVLSH